MTEHKVFNDLASIALDNFKDKPTSLTAGQQEASSILWTSADGHCKIGVWE
ncbi:MAG: cupin, partial [Rhodobacteraceae bacterium]|nr:cupin [Paracoccaceae bacterium]